MFLELNIVKFLIKNKLKEYTYIENNKLYKIVSYKLEDKIEDKIEYKIKDKIKDKDKIEDKKVYKIEESDCVDDLLMQKIKDLEKAEAEFESRAI